MLVLRIGVGIAVCVGVCVAVRCIVIMRFSHVRTPLCAGRVGS
jgi:hypothetical protein